ncbi:MAG: response regulator [Lachnospiraceae bacterium]|nr:response regulator [Lachnospiraceae bacterium]
MNILIIDDDSSVLNTLRYYLTGVGNVTTVSNGRQALQQARMQPFDVILLDIEMPVMNGFQTLDQLRNLEECINIPVIMITGKRDKYSVMNSISMGIDGYLLKPIHKDELIQKITEVYQKKQQHNNKKTILAIDDDMSYLKQLNSFLQESYNVIMINSTKLALDYLANHVPDLILLDYQMPLYNGVALLSILRQNGNCRNIPFIILSGTLDKKALLEFYPYEPSAYLAKPVSKDALLENVERALNQNDQKGVEG